MTTKITVDATAGHPVEVYMIDSQMGGIQQETSKVLVEAGQVQEFYVHDARELRIKELPAPPSPATDQSPVVA